ncbi:MAG: NAD(P)H-binding protein [Thermoleophilaceae bacterium]|nr:NAD(P)H-binding protein [Thermoleophilaceae bacterium]
MRALVTGATGKVGNALAALLVERGHEVRALVRDPARAAPLLPPGVEAVGGDVTEPASLRPAVEGCEVVFNAMGLPEQWLADESLFHEVNARGSESLARAARAAGVRRLVQTSTIDVFHCEPGGRLDETRVADYPKGTAYERSKQEAERLVLAAAGDELEVVLVNPAGVYGPGPGGGGSSFEQNLFLPAIRKRLPALPPGGCGVCFNAGAARGHLLAAERGEPGERYILCDRHVSIRELVETVVSLAGRGRVPPTLPVPLAKALAGAGEALSRATRRPPLLPRGQLHFFLWDAAPDSGKAQERLGWEPTPLEEGLRATLAAIAPAHA